MDIPNGVMCRYCGKRWFPHSLSAHERGCRRKITGLVDQLFQTYQLKFLYPPEYEEWPLPPKIDITSYNNHAFREYSSSFQQCPRCERNQPLIGLAAHLGECEAQPPQKKRDLSQTQTKASLSRTGVSTLTQTQQLKKTTTIANAANPKQQVIESLGQPVELPTETVIGANGKAQVMEIAPSGPDNRVQCQRCQRMFDPMRIDQHERICSKVKFQPTQRGEKDDRDPIEKLKERIQRGFDPMRYADMAGEDIGSKFSKPSKKPGQGNKNDPKAKTLQPPAKKPPPKDPYEGRVMDDGRISCVRCGRGFARDRVDKHQEVCTGLNNVTFSPPGAKALSNTTAQYGVKGAPGFQKHTVQKVEVPDEIPVDPVPLKKPIVKQVPQPSRTIVPPKQPAIVEKPLEKQKSWAEFEKGSKTNSFESSDKSPPKQPIVKPSNQIVPKQPPKAPSKVPMMSVADAEEMFRLEVENERKKAAAPTQSQKFAQRVQKQIEAGQGFQQKMNDIGAKMDDDEFNIGPKPVKQPPVNLKQATKQPMNATKAAKFCHECGQIYVDVAKFCAECGTKRIM